MSDPSADPPPDLQLLEQRLFARIEDERGPLAWLRGRGRLPRFALIVGLFAVEALFFWLFLLRHDFADHPPLRLVHSFGSTLHAARTLPRPAPALH